MKRTKVTLTAQTIVTLDTGTHDAIRDGGDLYVLLQSEETDGEEVSAEPSKKAEKPKAEPKGKSKSTASKKSTAKAKAKEEEEAEEEDEVVDDTKSKSKAKSKTKPKAKSKAKAKKDDDDEDEDLGEEIPQEEWKDLEEGEVVKAVIILEDDDPDFGKVWLAKVDGWKKIKGTKEEALFVTFDEDGETDYLREGDKLYANSVDL